MRSGWGWGAQGTGELKSWRSSCCKDRALGRGGNKKEIGLRLAGGNINNSGFIGRIEFVIINSEAHG